MMYYIDDVEVVTQFRWMSMKLRYYHNVFVGYKMQSLKKNIYTIYDYIYIYSVFVFEKTTNRFCT